MAARAGRNGASSQHGLHTLHILGDALLVLALMSLMALIRHLYGDMHKSRDESWSKWVMGRWRVCDKITAVNKRGRDGSGKARLLLL